MAGLPDAVPKAELHLHLEGSVAPATLRELNPSLEPDEIARRYRYSSFAEFIESFKWVVGFLKTPDDFALITRRLLQELLRQGVTYAEITLSVGVMLLRRQNAAAIYEAVVREAARSPVEVWWVVDAVRQFGPEHALEVARFAVERAHDRVVAFGIGGDELRGPMEWFHDAFSLATQYGLALVPHAGETGGPESVWSAVEAGARRIGHGIAAALDPALMRYLRDHDIPLEVCISSNVATGAVHSLDAHPLRRLFDAGVPIVLSTDDPAMFATSISREYELAETCFGFSEPELHQLAANSFHYALRRSTRR